MNVPFEPNECIYLSLSLYIAFTLFVMTFTIPIRQESEGRTDGHTKRDRGTLLQIVSEIERERERKRERAKGTRSE